VSKTYGQGVTANSIKIGIALVDFAPIQSFIDFNHGDEEKIDKVFIDDINKNGGIDGKQISVVYKKYTPIGSTFPTQVCTSMTEDEKVFAILGNIEDPTGASQLCVSKTHHTILIGHDMTDAELKGANPQGLMLTPDITAERRLNVLLSLVKKQNTLQGKTAAILSETSSKARAESLIKPALQDMGVKQGTSAVLAISGTDTTAAQSQLDSFIERWKTEGVNAVFISGPDVVSKQFVSKLTTQLPGVLLLTDAESSAVGSAQDAVAAHVNPNPYEGMLTANGLTDQDAFVTPNFQKCVKTYEDATGEKVIAPKDLKPGPDGKRVQVFVAISDICRELTMFKQIAAKAGPYLNNENWVNAVNALGTVTDMPSSQYASLHTAKYDADDSFALSAFDSKVNDFKNISEIQDASQP
jgi:ABC-type branched-subunit amino acid transport system substrate-binding protein